MTSRTEGSKMAGDTALWIDGKLENNSAFGESGLSVFPGGYRGFPQPYDTGWIYIFDCDGIGTNAVFWSATEASSYNAYFRMLYHDHSNVCRSSDYKFYGYSVRCVMDQIIQL